MKKTGKKVREALIAENERRYGAELREKYGADVVEASNEKFRTMPDSTYDRATALGEEINKRLRQAVPAGDPAGKLHRLSVRCTRSGCVCTGPTGCIQKRKRTVHLAKATLRTHALPPTMTRSHRAAHGFCVTRWKFTAEKKNQIHPEHGRKQYERKETGLRPDASAAP